MTCSQQGCDAKIPFKEDKPLHEYLLLVQNFDCASENLLDNTSNVLFF